MPEPPPGSERMQAVGDARLERNAAAEVRAPAAARCSAGEVIVLELSTAEGTTYGIDREVATLLVRLHRRSGGRAL